MPPKQKKPAASGADFEYCDVCRRNHDQGRSHRYIPGHRAALAAAIYRFRAKLSDVRFFLRNPSPVLPEHASRCRLWCLFCSADILELGSRFACSNAIYHLASAEHMRSVKAFLHKHGGQMDDVDSFKFSSADIMKWEKGCASLKAGAQTSKEGPIGPSPGPLKDIQKESTFNNLDTSTETYNPSFNSIACHHVMPLQSPTNGAYDPTSTEYSGTSISAPSRDYTLDHKGFLSADTFRIADLDLKTGLSTSVGNGTQPAVSCFAHNGMDKQIYSRGNTNGGLKANVHTGAPPPWLEASGDETCLVKKVAVSSDTLSSQKGQSKKLNPKRVGAAWAEKRRAEMEMEKRGEFAAGISDASWLPNFGRVWQSGTRKESRKEFEKQNHNHHNKNNHHEQSPEIKPYISKRMRRASEKHGQADNRAEEQANVFNVLGLNELWYDSIYISQLREH